MAVCTAYQPQTWQGATHESVSWRFKLTLDSQTHPWFLGVSSWTRRSSWYRGRRKPIVFMLNVHMWQYMRPQPRSLSAAATHAERRDALIRSRQAAGQKRARHKACLKDRSVRRYAAMHYVCWKSCPPHTHTPSNPFIFPLFQLRPRHLSHPPPHSLSPSLMQPSSPLPRPPSSSPWVGRF
jgi:hypothetical protein